MIEREQIEKLIRNYDRMREVMTDTAAEHRREGRISSARHCAGVAEGLSIAAVSLRCLLDISAQPRTKLTVVS